MFGFTCVFGAVLFNFRNTELMCVFCDKIALFHFLIPFSFIRHATMIRQGAIRVNTTKHDRAFSRVSVYRDGVDMINKKDISFLMNEVLRFVAN